MDASRNQTLFVKDFNRPVAGQLGGLILICLQPIDQQYDYGIQNGRVWLLSYQIAGPSTGTLPDWRKFDVARISKLEILSRLFLGKQNNLWQASELGPTHCERPGGIENSKG